MRGCDGIGVLQASVQLGPTFYDSNCGCNIGINISFTNPITGAADRDHLQDTDVGGDNAINYGWGWLQFQRLAQGFSLAYLTIRYTPPPLLSRHVQDGEWSALVVLNEPVKILSSFFFKHDQEHACTLYSNKICKLEIGLTFATKFQMNCVNEYLLLRRS